MHDVDFEIVTGTPFSNELENHEIDYELAQILGLGIVKNLYLDNDYYVYNASADNLDSNFGFMNEVVRIGVYYQITHPEYDDRELEQTIFGTKGGTEYLRLLQTVNTDSVLNRLKKVFDSKKGKIILFF